MTFVDQELAKISKERNNKTLKRMESVKALVPDDVPVELWKCLEEVAVEWLTVLFNRI